MSEFMPTCRLFTVMVRGTFGGTPEQVVSFPLAEFSVNTGMQEL